MLCVPAARLAVLQVTVLLLALPLGSATAAQPVRVVPSAVKVTLPVGARPVTVAVKVTLAPTTDEMAELASVVVVVLVPPMLTVRVSALEVALLTVTLMPLALSV